MKLIHAVYMCVMISTLVAAFEHSGTGWPHASGNISVVGYPELTRAMINPSLLDQDPSPHLQFIYFTPYHGLNIHAGSIRSQVRVNGRPIIGGLNYLGDEIYQESHISLGIPIKIDSVFSAGLSFNILHLEVGDVLDQSTLTLSPGIMYRFSEEIHFGSSMLNLIQIKKSFKVAQKFQTGVAYSTSRASIMMAIEKESALPTEFCLGLTLDLLTHMQIAAGFRDKSQTISMGWKFVSHSFDFHYYYIFHPVLPGSHGLGLEIDL